MRGAMQWMMVAAAFLAASAARAAGRPAAETCVDAGYRMGTAAYDRCAARLTADDPLAGLERADLETHGDGVNDPDAVKSEAPAIPVPPAGWNSTSPPWWNFSHE